MVGSGAQFRSGLAEQLFKQTQIAKRWQRLTLLFDLKRCSDCLKFEKLNIGLERYFQMKQTASQSDKADRRYTGLLSK